MKKALLIILFLSLTFLTIAPAQAITAEVACKTSPLLSIKSSSLTPWAVVCGAAVDAINPCSLSILILLMASSLVNGERKKALKAGLSFIAAVYFTYFLLGIGVLAVIRTYTVTFSPLFYQIVGVMAILFGLFNIKDYFWYGKVFLMEVPLLWRPKMKELIFGVTSPKGAFLIGLLISLFLLPCLSGPYAVILAMLATNKELLHALIYMVLYNIIFILPMTAVVLAMYFGLPPEKAEAWRKEKLRLSHLIAGIILLALGVIILGGWL